VAKLQITWVKSGIGYPPTQRRTLKALGFRRLHQTIEHEDNGSIRGMLVKVNHLVKGQKSRSGGGTRLSFEGGQLPLVKRLPRLRGFFNRFKISYTVVNVGKLNIFEANTEVTPQVLLEAGLIKSTKQTVKVLGDGEIDRPLMVKASKFSAAAKSKIEAAGGKAEGI
jgi:large subunit ribosomal protein L15